MTSTCTLATVVTMADHPLVTDPDTHFSLVRADHSDRTRGILYGAPTGEVECDECGGVGWSIETIDHIGRCEQAEVKWEGWPPAGVRAD